MSLFMSLQPICKYTITGELTDNDASETLILFSPPSHFRARRVSTCNVSTRTGGTGRRMLMNTMCTCFLMNILVGDSSFPKAGDIILCPTETLLCDIY